METATERNYCNVEHIQKASAFCVVCNSYVCEDCFIESHFNHEMIHLDAECLKKYSDYKRLMYEAQIMCKQYEKVSERQSVDEILNNITTKIASKFDELIKKIEIFKEKKMADLMETPEIKKLMSENEKQHETFDKLKSIHQDAAKLMAEIEDQYSSKRLILLYERDSAKEIAGIKKRLEEWKTNSSVAPLKIEQFGSDINIELKANEKKLNSLVLNYLQFFPIREVF